LLGPPLLDGAWIESRGERASLLIPQKRQQQHVFIEISRCLFRLHTSQFMDPLRLSAEFPSDSGHIFDLEHTGDELLRRELILSILKVENMPTIVGVSISKALKMHDLSE
jgi:hypothetical protein